MTSMMGFISLCSRVAAGAHSHSEASILQLEFVRLRLVENSEDDPGLRISARECVEIICENLRNLWLIPVLIAPVAQLDRALASGAKGCGFDPRRAHVFSDKLYVVSDKKHCGPRSLVTVHSSLEFSPPRKFPKP